MEVILLQAQEPWTSYVDLCFPKNVKAIYISLWKMTDTSY